MGRLKQKLRSSSGVTIVFALAIFLVTSVFCLILVNGALTATLNANDQRLNEQAYLSARSAAKLLQSAVEGESVTVTTWNHQMTAEQTWDGDPKIEIEYFTPPAGTGNTSKLNEDDEGVGKDGKTYGHSAAKQNRSETQDKYHTSDTTSQADRAFMDAFLELVKAVDGGGEVPEQTITLELAAPTAGAGEEPDTTIKDALGRVTIELSINNTYGVTAEIKVAAGGKTDVMTLVFTARKTSVPVYAVFKTGEDTIKVINSEGKEDTVTVPVLKQELNKTVTTITWTPSSVN